MKKARTLISALLCAAMLIPATSCSSSDKPLVTEQTGQVEITLSWWGNDARNEYTIEGVRQFMELHPEIVVKCSYSEWSGYESRNNVKMVSNTEADVMQINYGWLDKYSPDGTGYYDISTLSDQIDLSNFDDKMLEYGKVNGILNAIPIAMNVETVYSNQTVLSKYRLQTPSTFDDFFEAAKVLSKDDIYVTGGTDKSIWLFCIAYGEQTTGKKILNDNGTLNFTADDFAVMIDFYCRLINEKVIPQVEYYDRIHITDGTYAGSVAWVSDAKNYCGGAVEAGNTMTVADYTSANSAPNGTGWYSKPATMYAISKNTEHPKESAMLLDFLLNSSEMAELQGIEKGIPLSKSARAYLESQGKLDGLQYQASLKMESNEFLTPIDPIIENSDLVDSFVNSCDLVLYDKAELNEAASQFEQSFNDLLAANK